MILVSERDLDGLRRLVEYSFGAWLAWTGSVCSTCRLAARRAAVHRFSVVPEFGGNSG